MKRMAFSWLILVSAIGSARGDQMFLMPFGPSALVGVSTVWRTYLIVDNDSDRGVRVNCSSCNDTVPPGGYYVFEGPQGGPDRIGPEFLLLPDDLPDSVHLALRVTTINGSSVRLMDLPLARAADFRADALHLDYLPLGNGARQSLRIYDREGRDGTRVRVQIRRLGTTFVDTIVTLQLERNAGIGANGVHPAVYEANDVRAAFPELRDSASGIDVIVTPLTPDSHIWALYTSTENGSQQFQSFTPR